MKHILIQWGLQIAYALILAFTMAIFKNLYTSIKRDHENDKAKQEAIMMGIQSILYYGICVEGELIIKKGEITKQELRDMEYFYNSYSKLNGNGVAKKIYEECRKLPLAKGEHYD